MTLKNFHCGHCGTVFDPNAKYFRENYSGKCPVCESDIEWEEEWMLLNDVMVRPEPVPDKNAVLVNGIRYETYVINEIVRFKGNRIVRDLLGAASSGYSGHAELTMNDISIRYQKGDYTAEEVRQLYRLIESSIGCYEETFEEDKIEEVGS